MAGDIEVRDNPDLHRFEAELDGKVAVAEYRLAPDKIIFTHTEVPPGREGRGVGKALIKGALADVRDRGLKVVPLCTFVARYMATNPDTQDMLDSNFHLSAGS